MDASTLIDDLLIRIYEPPLSTFRDDGRIRDTTNPLSVVMLLIDYETECSMNGVVGYLGSSSGSRVPETILALRLVGCSEQAQLLSEIHSTAQSARLTFDMMQNDEEALDDEEPLDDFEDEQYDEACETIQELHDKVEWDRFWKATEAYVSQNLDAIQVQLQRL